VTELVVSVSTLCLVGFFGLTQAILSIEHLKLHQTHLELLKQALENLAVLSDKFASSPCLYLNSISDNADTLVKK
jgi:hypothetical protein